MPGATLPMSCLKVFNDNSEAWRKFSVVQGSQNSCTVDLSWPTGAVSACRSPLCRRLLKGTTIPFLRTRATCIHQGILLWSASVLKNEHIFTETLIHMEEFNATLFWWFPQPKHFCFPGRTTLFPVLGVLLTLHSRSGGDEWVVWREERRESPIVLMGVLMLTSTSTPG